MFNDAIRGKRSHSLTVTKGVQKKLNFTWTKNAVKEELVKSLRRVYAERLSDSNCDMHFMKQTGNGLPAIDSSKLSGKYKICCLQFGLYLRLS